MIFHPVATHHFVNSGSVIMYNHRSQSERIPPNGQIQWPGTPIFKKITEEKHNTSPCHPHVPKTQLSNLSRMAMFLTKTSTEPTSQSRLYWSTGCNTAALVYKLPEAAVYRVPQRNKAACVKLFEMLEHIRNKKMWQDFNMEELCPLCCDLADLVHAAPGRRLLWIFWYPWY